MLFLHSFCTVKFTNLLVLKYKLNDTESTHNSEDGMHNIVSMAVVQHVLFQNLDRIN